MLRIHFRSKTASAITCAATHLCLLGALTSAAHAAPPRQDSLWLAVGDQQLKSMRGGFSMGDGLLVSFGITRAVFINGALITETTLNVGRMADLSPAQASQLSQKLETLSLVQNGPGNTFASGPSSTTSSSPGATGPTVTAIAGNSAGTLIQNSLNNQQIRYQTIINASSNVLGMARSLNLHNTLADSIRQSVGQR